MQHYRLWHGCLAVAALLIAAAAWGYIDQPAENLTLPKLLKEFKSVAVLRATKVDSERGKVLWEAVEQIQGAKPQGVVRHQVTLNGRVPDEFKAIKPGTEAIFFCGDRWKRGLTLVDGHWYVCDADADGAWWRMSFTEKHYDFHCCFTGSVAELRDALRKLIDGKPAVVTSRKIRGVPTTQRVRYYPDKPDRKEPLPDDRPAPKP